MEKYKISVIVTVYNVEQYLDDCIQSILNQTYTNLEIILVNDGSTDNSLKICQKYKKRDSRIVLINQDNAGAVVARKSGIDRATGEYVTFVDGDDWIEIDTYKCILQTTMHEDIIMYGLVEEYGYKTVKRTNSRGINEVLAITQHMLCNGIFFEFGVLPNLVCKLFRTHIMKKIAPDVSNTLTMGDDAAFVYSALAQAQSLKNLEITPYHYRQHENSLVRKTVSSKSIVDLYRNMLEINVSEKLRMQWEKQVIAYMAFILQLKCTDIFVKNVSFYKKFYDKKVVIYGAGNYGLTVCKALQKAMSVKIIGIADRDYHEIRKKYPEVIAPEDICTLDYDILYIGILNEKTCATVSEKLKAMGIEEQKIIYFKMQDVRTEDVRKTLESIDK